MPLQPLFKKITCIVMQLCYSCSIAGTIYIVYFNSIHGTFYSFCHGFWLSFRPHKDLKMFLVLLAGQFLLSDNTQTDK